MRIIESSWTPGDQNDLGSAWNTGSLWGQSVYTGIA